MTLPADLRPLGALGALQHTVPSTRVLGHERHSVLVTASGTGASFCGGLALTPFSGDRVEDPDGFFLYLRDLDSRAFWSAGLRPVDLPGAIVRAHRAPGAFVLERVEEEIETRMEICVDPDAPVEIRRLTLRNRSGWRRRIEITSAVEVVLNHPAAHAAHPAFSKLFLQTERDSSTGALLARRRPRAAGEEYPWMVHALLGAGVTGAETDRARFLGRCTPASAPRALVFADPLSGTTGNVLDPLLCLRSVLRLGAGEEATVAFLLGTGADRDRALALAARCRDGEAVEETFRRAEDSEDRLLSRIGLGADEAEYFQDLAGAILYGHPGLAAPESRGSPDGQAGDLARHGIVPGRPYVLHSGTGKETIPPDLRKAHRYWRSLGLSIDLVILGGGKPEEDGAPGCLVLDRDALGPGDLDLLRATARWSAGDGLPDLAAARAIPAPGPGRHPSPPEPDAVPPDSGERLLFFNGCGGFSEDGREYVIRLRYTAGEGHVRPPRPWINVLANERFGSLVSETGSGHTWFGNSRTHRLTPWSNDPLLDPHGEAFYVRDEESGAFWSPFPGPAPAAADYETRHGFGTTRCRLVHDGLEMETTAFVSPLDPVRFTMVRLVNRGERPRVLSLFAYYRLVLGERPEESGRFVRTGAGGEPGVLFARNPVPGEFTGTEVFASVAAPARFRSLHVSGDRTSFLGAGGDPSRPAALRDRALNGRVGSGLDPCLAQQIVLELAPGEETEVAWILGADDGGEARLLASRYASPEAVRGALREARGFWERILTTVTVSTPSPALDLMLNGRLLYQVLACRMWGRTALYQSGGAFGFRDQLQDASALAAARPDLLRAQILLHAAHQFEEGDVLHWWHPPRSRGIRTRFADDLAWLPALTAFYVGKTGDEGVLDEEVRFLTARPLEPGEDEAFLLPEDSGRSGSLYEHCCRALDRALTRGRHGLPLFGTGDWNDGMNRVGREGKGESVWLGFFFHHTLGTFLPLCEGRRDTERAGRYRAERERLLAALNDAGWDGEWYRRGYYDDGAPLGSKESDECRIDVLVQAWAVLSGAAPPERRETALDAVERHLVSDRDRLIRLLTPPFDRTPHDPGYIKGYVPGVRENGGQYTHAALWLVQAMAEAGRRDRAAELLDLLNPVNHARTPEEVARYRVEPYVIAADVYGEPPHVGRGGWTWYTGSAGWMVRVALESVLGFRLSGRTTLLLAPRIPDAWPEVRIDYRPPGEETRYAIHVVNPDRRAETVVSAAVDGKEARVEDGAAHVPLTGDGRSHRVEVVLGRKAR